ncbi:MAG TPA: CBS domain-containing protein [Flavobacteriales bacterium]
MNISNQFLRKDFPVLNAQDDPVSALNLMDEYRVNHLPVVENGKFLGLISESALLGVESIIDDGDTLQLLKASVKPDTHILEILKVMSQYSITTVPVVDYENNYLGVVLQEDLVSRLSEMQGMHQPGGIIVLEMWEKDYSMQQIARIIEENNAKILSTTVSPGDDGKIELNIKINQPDLNAIMQSFERFGYTIKGTYQESAYTENLQSRYEELMRFLNI